jgi:pimeloyl-ACP methyl ester carboxylesterase
MRKILVWILLCSSFISLNAQTIHKPLSVEAVSDVFRLLNISFEQHDWEGYPRFDFRFQDREGILVLPKKSAEGNPWIWRPAFFGHEPQTDLSLLSKGWYVAYYDLTDLYGSPRAITLGNDFYTLLTGSFALSDRTVPEGFSRGGLFAFNWAAAYPDKVACIYVDAPVCDFKSWPAAGDINNSSELWAECLKEYGFTKEEAWTYSRNPVDNLYPLAKIGIPVIAVCGEADEAVPYKDNMGVVQQRYRDMGGYVEVILKPGVGHHPHSLKDPKPIVDFILKVTSGNR